jgi:cyclophilin family peptidyl-prolyl cis-trans isomerase
MTPRRSRPAVWTLVASLFVLLVLVAAAPASNPRPRVVLETVRGDIVIELHPEDAPQTVANFLKLVSHGYYDSLTFHRVVPGFVIQGGDPNSRDANPFNDGEGGPGYTIPAEIKAKHVKGAVAMARQPDPVNPERASNGSQFYIALRELTQLDGAYTVFGQVVSGWATVDSIVALADRKDIARVGTNANPGVLAMIRHARVLPAEKAAKQPAKPAAAVPPASSGHR